MKVIKTHVRPIIFIFELFGLTTYLWLARFGRAFLNPEIVMTSIFAASPHAASILNELPIVGSLEGYPLISVNEANTHNEYDD